jgi:hypothetical protein
LTLDPGGDLQPALGRYEGSFRHRRIPANPRSPSRVEQAIWIEERNQRQRDHVYLAEPIPVASAAAFI